MFAALAVAVPAVVTVVSMLPSDAATLPATGGTYQLAVTKSGKCIDVPGASTTNGALLQQWGCTSSATWQQFKLVATGSNYQLVNASSGKCIDVRRAGTVRCGSDRSIHRRFLIYRVVNQSSGPRPEWSRP